MSKVMNILFCGVGGQGILKASEIAGIAAMLSGYHVKKSEVHGMAQRGGSVESHLRIGKLVYSPLIERGTADLIVPFNEDEAKHYNFYLHKGGENLVKYLEKAKEYVPDKIFINTYMLGVLSAFLEINEDDWIKAFSMVFKKHLNENEKVFKHARRQTINDMG